MREDKHPETLGFALIHVFRLHRARAHQLLEGLGLYQGQPPVLRALWEQEGLTQSQLAGVLDIAPATTTKMLQRMEKAGFIQRRPDEQDQRISRVYLTELGRAVQTEVEQVFRRLDAETFGTLSAEDQAVLYKLLLALRENLLQVAAM